MAQKETPVESSPGPVPDIEDLLPQPIDDQPAIPAGMKKFTVYRRGDKSGVSGIGVVIQGVLFADGHCAYQWLVGPDPGDTVTKMFKKFIDVHIGSHPENRTIITFEDGTQMFFPPEEEPVEEEK